MPPRTTLSKLLKLGGDVDALDNCHWTPVCHAAEAGHDEIVDWLLEHGAEVTRGHENSSTPVGDCACVANTLNSPRT